jgi:hypothetical protein
MYNQYMVAASTSPVLAIGATEDCGHTSVSVLMLWTDETVFSLSGGQTPQNFRLWATENPHATRQSSLQQRFGVNV